MPQVPECFISCYYIQNLLNLLFFHGNLFSYYDFHLYFRINSYTNQDQEYLHQYCSLNCPESRLSYNIHAQVQKNKLDFSWRILLRSIQIQIEIWSHMYQEAESHCCFAILVLKISNLSQTHMFVCS